MTLLKLDASCAEYLIQEVHSQLPPGMSLTEAAASILKRQLLRASPDLFSSRYQISLRSSPQTIYEDRSIEDGNNRIFSTLDLRKILVNEEVHASPLPLECFFQWIAQRVSQGYSSTRLANNLKTDSALANILASCDHKFSLLAKLETYFPADEEDDSTSSAETRKRRVVIEPFLIVPAVSPKNKAVIRAWEQRHIMKYDEGSFAGIPYRTRVREV